jgi:hypothetical protein
MSATILVQMADHPWTLSALHLAFAMSRRTDAEVALVKFVSVTHAQWLGTSLGDKQLTTSERDALAAYQATAEDYGIPLVLHTMQYVTLLDAIVQAAEQVDAQAVFANLEPGIIPLWHRFQLWRLQQILQHNKRQFYSLEQPTDTDSAEWVPSVLVANPRIKR